MERTLKQLLTENNLKLKKAFGQNFLTDGALLSEIVDKAGVTAGDRVLEIGCGAGALTVKLSEKAERVVAYEIDERLKPILRETLSDRDNVKVVFKDVMKEKISAIENAIGGKYKMVANLPYYITTPIVMKFLENAENLTSMSIMVQKEVAERFSAKPSTSDYGAITVGINLRGTAKTVLAVPREKFTPVPNVDSAVVRIDIEKDKFSCDLAAVRDTVRVGFSGRRKMLVNNLMNGFKLNRERAETALIKADVPLTARAENLSAEDFVRLTAALKEIKG
ncbi:MAG: ribosomal RNA small subunit methyltransferase A [Clostridia bacterium]|nr:ribosomal RNA small subunit methyltransferase A [Clostridia bacterium]